MTLSLRRVCLAVGLAVVWQLFVVLGVGGLSHFVHGTVDLEWLVKLLMFPLGVLGCEAYGGGRGARA
jgi:hypothetical protein